MINRKPIIAHQLDEAIKINIKSVYILLGYKGNLIETFVKKNYSSFFKLIFITEKTPLGTGGAIKQLEMLLSERFMVFYSDTIFNINLKKFIEFDKKKDSIGSLVSHPNDHPFDSDLIETNDSNKIIKFHSYPHDKSIYLPNNVSAALYILSPKIFKYIVKDEFSDLAKNIFPKTIVKESLFAYKTIEFIKDVGTPERINYVRKLFRKNKNIHLPLKSKVVFLDRDGVINVEKDNLSSADQLELIKGASEAIRLLNQNNFLVIIVTNQPQISKGFLSFNDLKLIHNKLEFLLGIDGAYVDDIFYCPHHPEVGFNNEVKSLKIKCDCRKPNPGMLLQAKSKYNINFSYSWMIGDRYCDIEAGLRIRAKTILLKTGLNGNDKLDFPNTNPDFIFEDLKEAVNYILNSYDHY